jgi:hypothetical protein
MAIHERFGQLQVETKGGFQAAARVPQIAGPAAAAGGAPEFAFKGNKVRVVICLSAPRGRPV